MVVVQKTMEVVRKCWYPKGSQSAVVGRREVDAGQAETMAGCHAPGNAVK
jgi:hypothetical protein